MTITPEITSSDFLKIVDIHILNKIKLAEERASEFTSISIKDSCEKFMMPCLLAIKIILDKVSEISEEKKYNAQETYDLLIYHIFMKSVELEALKEKVIGVISVTGLSLAQLMCADIMEEISLLIKENKG
ncbi:MAG: hypothetical protein V7L14_02725 [Nostoc sp.]|uniref:hypothetical protein n=1 Tax=Nostoc sp. TaxID=1180 RepID=UPI002FF63D03